VPVAQYSEHLSPIRINSFSQHSGTTSAPSRYRHKVGLLSLLSSTVGGCCCFLEGPVLTAPHAVTAASQSWLTADASCWNSARLSTRLSAHNTTQSLSLCVGGPVAICAAAQLLPAVS
jgi:hypothetical protein